MKIYLIGMPGSGKSTLGKKVAHKLSLPFIDLDEAIEQRCGKTISDIFKDEGEDFFRKVEAELLRELSEKDAAFVMATGGGAPCHHMGIDYINTRGTSLFINVPAIRLLERLQANGLDDRPLLTGTPAMELLHSLEDKLRKRLPVYKRARLEVSGENLRPGTLIAALHTIHPELRPTR